jgi:hypothetical protein
VSVVPLGTDPQDGGPVWTPLVLDGDGPLPAADTARLGVGLLGAVRALHATRTAHLGIDPGTVLLVDRRVRLVGLGAARRLGGRVPAATDVHGVGATLQAVLDPAEDGGLREVLATLTAADPGDRPTVEEGLALLVPHAGGGVVRPWPRWADRELPRPPGRGRPGLRPA